MDNRSMNAPPRGLRKPGLQLWRDTHESVAEGWQLDAKDLALLEEACRLRDTAARLARRVDREGSTLTGPDGKVGVHPLLRELRMTRQLIAQTMHKVQIAPPTLRTGGMNARQRQQLADARRHRWPRAVG
jgi:phage terminase small subunit